MLEIIPLHMQMQATAGLLWFLETNAKYAEEWPNITRKGDAPADADDWKDVANKFDEHFSPNPAPRD